MSTIHIPNGGATLHNLRKTRKGADKYGFSTLGPGDAMFVPYAKPKVLLSYVYLRARQLGVKFSARVVKAGDQLGAFTAPADGVIVSNLTSQ